MEIGDLRISILALKRNIAKLKKKAEKSKKSASALEKAEKKLKKRIDELERLGVDVKTIKKRKHKKKFSFRDYRQYIKSSAWGERRREYFSAHDSKCRSCGSDKRPIHLHHRTYDRLYNEEDGDLMPLCEDCHSMLHLFQKTHRINAEVATEIWLSVTNGTPKRKKIREVLRRINFQMFRGEWAKRKTGAASPAQSLSMVIEKLAEIETITRNDALEDEFSAKNKIAFARRTGNVDTYDRMVDGLIKKLERS